MTETTLLTTTLIATISSALAIISSVVASAKWIRGSVRRNAREELSEDFAEIKLSIELIDKRAEERFRLIESKAEERFNLILFEFDSVFKQLDSIQVTLEHTNYDLTAVEEKVFQLEYKPKTEGTTTRPLSMRQRMARGRRNKRSHENEGG